MSESHYDVIIAGGGLSGVLSALNIRNALPKARILIIEKEEVAGGRLRTTCEKDRRWGFGLNVLSRRLLDYTVESAASVVESFTAENYDEVELNRFAHLSGSKLSEYGCADVLRVEGAKKIAGRNAGKEFAQLEDLYTKFESDEEGSFKDDRMLKLLKLKRKSAGGVALETQAVAAGIPDVWSASLACVHGKMQAHSQGLFKGRWDEFCEDMLDVLSADGKTDVFRKCHIVRATKEDGRYVFKTEKGELTASELVVAQNPWSAIRWLDKELFPVDLLNIVLKSKPVSLVTLTTLKKDTSLLPDLSIIAAEKCTAFAYQNAVTFQATIDYEMSLAAPEVVKAVKRLRRSRQRATQFFEGLELEGEFVALLPCAWPVPTGFSDLKLVDKLGRKEMLIDGKPVFCGDTYGRSFDGDENILSSVPNVVDAIVQRIAPNVMSTSTVEHSQQL